MSLRPLSIGTRGSDLAMWQANRVKEALSAHGGGKITIKTITTKGDAKQNVAFGQLEGQGFFTREIEDSLLAREIDLGVHSLKDLMTTQPEGLKIGAVGFRDDRRDVLLIRPDAYAEGGVLPVKEGGVVGTSSMRRQCQVAHHNPYLMTADIRGNVPTRINKLREGQYDALILAAAGLQRLEVDLTDLIAIYMDAELFLPAPGQGMLAIEIRDDDPEVEKFVAKLGTDQDIIETELERGLLKRFDSGCSLPLGVRSFIVRDKYRLVAILGLKEGDTWLAPRRCDVTGNNLQVIVDRCHRRLTAPSG